MVHVIYLNGTSSAGKSSIARALHTRLDDLYLYISLVHNHATWSGMGSGSER